jgi:hypothetical protein
VKPSWALIRNGASRSICFVCAAIHDLGGAIMSVQSEAQYLKFEMAQSVQNWRHKWFYIKDQKFCESDEYGLAPFDPAKGTVVVSSTDLP